MKYYLTGFLFLFLYTIESSAKNSTENRDTSIVVNIDPFLKKLLSVKGKINVVKGSPQSFLQMTERDLNYRRQEIIRTNTRLFVHLDGTGILFEGKKHTDTTILFTRIDHTVNVNYNSSGYLFTEGENIYIFGGYGFWKSDGLLKKFNFVDREWDIVPLSKEVYPPGTYSAGIWHDAKANRIYLLTELPVNEAIIDEEDNNSSSRNTNYLDLNTMKWVEQPRLHQKTQEILKKGYFLIQNERGILFSHEMNVYFIDIKANQVLKSTDRSFAQTISRLSQNDLFFLEKDKIFFKTHTIGKLDSLKLQMDKFQKESYPIYTWSIPEYLYWSLLMLLLISFVIYTSSRINHVPTNHISSGLMDQKKIDFTGIELSLIQFLMNKSRKQQRANIHDLNYALGVKDKNIGLQKKMRSDVINSVNEKFRYISGYMEPLICIERSLSDKRYFEYFIRQENIGLLSAIIKKVNDK